MFEEVVGAFMALYKNKYKYIYIHIYIYIFFFAFRGWGV